MGIVSMKPVKIKPANRTEGKGTIVDCRYAGSSRVGIGPFAKTTEIFKAYIEVEGLPKKLVVKVKEAQVMSHAGINDIKQGIKQIGRMFGKVKLPVEIGAKVVVEYDKVKPKKCNILETVLQ